jgi:hypothetical protein
VALEGEAGPKDEPHANRYNLACALSLLGEKDAAFPQLAKSFEIAKDRLSAAAYRGFVVHATKDEDLAPLREDPRFKEVLEKATGGGAAPSGM